MTATELDRARLRRGLDQIHDPVALARRYLAHRNLLGGPDEDDLLDVAIDAIVNAALAWRPDGGRSILSWAWLYMDRDVSRELGRCHHRRTQLAHTDNGALGVEDRWRYHDSTDGYHRIELRVDLQRWADLAELTPLMRFLVDYAAHHLGTYVRDTALAAAGPSPLRHPTLRLALKHLRTAAVTGVRRDDRWTRMRDRRAIEERSNRALAAMRAVEAARDETVARSLAGTA